MKRVLDDKDLMLIRELEIDGRASYRRLAGILGTSRTTVARRIQNLVSEKVISFASVVTPAVKGHVATLGLKINARPGKIDAVAAQLAAIPEIRHIVLLTGRYEILAWAFLRSSSDAPGFFSKELANVSDVSNIKSFMVLKEVKSSWAYLGSQESIIVPDNTEPELQPLETALIRELELAPRQTVLEMSQKLGVSTPTVRSKLRKLRDEGLIRVVSIPNPRALGFDVNAVVLTKADISHAENMADELAHRPNVRYVGITTGEFNVLASVAFRELTHLYDFLYNDLVNIPGVISHETVMIVKVFKHAYTGFQEDELPSGNHK